MTALRSLFIIAILFMILLGSANVYAQGNLYTARGYWEETNRPNFVALKQKLEERQKADSQK